MIIKDYTVYGLMDAIELAGFPMQITTDRKFGGITPDLVNRGGRLGKTMTGMGHDKFLRFVTVIATIIAPRYWWQEFSTYHFAEMDSQSTMHRITKMNLSECCNEYVDKTIIEIVQRCIDDYNNSPSEEKFLKIKANLPEGFEIGAGVCMNYATLKTMYQQRKSHRLPEWKQFCKWVETLPYAKEWGVCS